VSFTQRDVLYGNTMVC